MGFYDEPKEEVQVSEEPQKIKLGEQEYTQEELNDLVGLGKVARESEQKYNTKIDKVWPRLNQVINEKQELERQFNEFKESQISKKHVENVELSPEEQKAIAKRQARELGILLEDDFDQKYIQRRNAERFLETIESTMEEAKKHGKPSTSVEDMLEYMQEHGYKRVDVAYKERFADDLEKWTTEQSKKLKGSSSFVTETRTTAGSKQPNPVKPNRDNLYDLVLSTLGGGE